MSYCHTCHTVVPREKGSEIFSSTFVSTDSARQWRSSMLDVVLDTVRGIVGGFPEVFRRFVSYFYFSTNQLVVLQK